MKVWVVEGWYDYSYSDILGVYSTEEAANRRELEIRETYNGTHVHKLEIDEDIDV